MFIVTESDATAIRAVLNEGGEFSAAIKLPRLFPCIAKNATALKCAWKIAGWTPRPAAVTVPGRLRPFDGDTEGGKVELRLAP